MFVGPNGSLWIPPIVAEFRIVPVPTDTTTSLVMEDLLLVPGGVDVISAGDLLLDFDASLTATPDPTDTSFNGGALQFLWDGAPLVDNAFFEIDPGIAGTGFDSFAMVVRFRSLVVAPALGNHTLAVQWQVFQATASLGSFAGSGNLTIQSAPR